MTGPRIRHLLTLLATLLATQAQAQPAPAPPPPDDTKAALQSALRNYPPLILGANTRTANPDGTVTKPQSCPAAGSRVERQGAPPMEYQGASPTDPNLCRIKVGDDTIEAWYGIWATAWPGADLAHRALDRVIASPTGDVAGFDTQASPDLKWHDLIRLEGIEDIRLLGRTYTAMKLSHYREGYDGNTYRSLATVWKDIPTGLLIYGTYQHISGAPELDGTLTPTAILPIP